MRSRTVYRILCLVLLFVPGIHAWAQASCENPLEYLALAEGNIMINKNIESQITGQAETAALENIIAAEFRKIHEWESKYSQYTQTVSGFASSLNAASHIYDDALRIMLSIGDLRHSIASSTEGVVATMSLNTLYIEAATELVSCFTLIRQAVSKGGKSNMLTGAERSQILWEINDKLDSFSKKLQRLSLCVRYYRMADIWNHYTAGMYTRSNGDMARTAFDRWRRSARAIQ